MLSACPCGHMAVPERALTRCAHILPFKKVLKSPKAKNKQTNKKPKKAPLLKSYKGKNEIHSPSTICFFSSSRGTHC
jgi:hypothetical protein